jgi:ABC-2 type transport system permease protein
VSTVAAEAAPELREISGPSAFGGGTRRFLHLLWLNALADLKLRYVGSALGYLWTLIRPLLFFAILYAVFTKVFLIGDSIPNYPEFLIVNIMLFEFFAEATTVSVKSVVAHENVVRKMQFPRIVIPLATVLTSSITLCLDLVAAFAIMLILGVGPFTTWLLTPVIILMLVFFTAGVSLILSSLYVRFRDLEHIWGVAVRALLYALPVLYSMSFIAQQNHTLAWLVAANPLTPVFTAANVWITDPTAQGPAAAVGSSIAVILPLLVMAIVPLFGLWFFNREAPRVAEAL